MSHRTQITLDDDQYERLTAVSSASGHSLAELIRRAVDTSYPPITLQHRLQALTASAGAWANRDDLDGAAYVESIRPGLGRKLAAL